MQRIRSLKMVVISTLVSLLAAGCNQADKESVTQITPTQVPTIEIVPTQRIPSQAPDSAIDQNDPSEKNLFIAQDGKFHLSGYDFFEDDNKKGVYGSLVISEEWINNEPYYSLTSGKIKILVDALGDTWTLYDGDDEKKMDIIYPFQGGSNAGSIVTLNDCIGLGKPQLIIIHYGGGTGVQTQRMRIFNIDTLNEYQVEDYTKKLEEFVKLKVVSLNKDEVIIKTIANGKSYQGKYEPFYKDKEKYKTSFHYINSIDVSKDGKVFVKHNVHSDPNNILGSVTAELVYDGTQMILKTNTLKFSE